MKETLLIGIGAQKAGSTWLAEYLRDRQPDVHLPQVKEVHFFDNYCMPNYGSYFEDQRLENLKSEINELSKSDIVDASKNANLLAKLNVFMPFENLRLTSSF